MALRTVATELHDEAQHFEKCHISLKSLKLRNCMKPNYPWLPHKPTELQREGRLANRQHELRVKGEKL